MARWATLCEIAGVSFTGCRVEVVGGRGFLSPVVGSSDFGNDATVHTQTITRGVKGIKFGLQMVSAEQSKIEDARDAINTAQLAGDSFVVEVIDGIFNINVYCDPDYSQEEWLTLGQHSEGWYEGVTWRFISKSEA